MTRGSAPVALAIALALGASLSSRSATADTRLQGIGEVSVGYSDNPLSAPDVPIPGTSPKQAGGFLVLRPGVVLAGSSARVVHRIGYTYSYNLFFEQTSASTSSNQLEYRGFFDLSPSVGLIAGASVVQSTQYSAIVLTPPGAGAVNATPPGSGAFLSATADELMSVDLGPGLRGYEGLSATEQTPIFDTVAPRTFLPMGHLGLERAFQTDAVGAEARAEYSLVENSLSPSGVPLGPQRQIIGTGVGLWRRDWGRDFTSRVEAGALRVQRFDSGAGLWQPTGIAAFAYVNPAGDAELAYAHRVTTNLLLGQTLLIDEVRLQGSVPVTKKGEVRVAASGGYQHGWLLDENLTLAARVDAILADVGVSWQATELLLLGVRYQHAQQISDAQVPPLPLSFARNSVMIGVGFRFPPERTMPRAYRAPRRVDRTDELRDTVEPAQGGSQPAPGGGGT